MLCDACEEVFFGEPETCGECAFCSEACFERWFAAARARAEEERDGGAHPSVGAARRRPLQRLAAGKTRAAA